MGLPRQDQFLRIHTGHFSWQSKRDRGHRRARALYAQGCELPVITESRDEVHRRQAMELRCAAFLLKPFSAQRLIDTARKAIGSKLN